MDHQPAQMSKLSTSSLPAALELPISFQDLRFRVTAADGTTREIMKGVCGKAESGKMLAVMGPTGCGKTTLLNLLAGRITPNEGHVSYGDYGWSKGLKRRVGFVEQDDIVFPALTVRETLAFSARLRLPKEMDLTNKLKRVEEVISALLLNKCANTKVGSGLDRGVSGGERKRLSIASELLTNPSILFLDEPTSGLDSSIAHMVMQCVQDLATAQNITAVVSIHQPSSQIYSLFSDLLFLYDGNVLYRGEARVAAVSYFAQLGLQCPPTHNPPDFLMDLVVLGTLPPEAAERVQKDFGPGTLIVEPPTKKLLESTRNRYEASYWEQMRVIFERTYKTEKGSLFDSNNAALFIGLALLSGFLWLRIGYNEGDIFLRSAVAFWVTSTWMFFPLFGSLGVFPSSELTLRKELAVASYRLSAWFIAHTSVIFILSCVWPLLWLIIVQYMTGVNDNFGIFLASYALTVVSIFAHQCLGLLISASVPGHRTITVAILIITFFFAYSGFFNPNLPQGLDWCKYVSLMIYVYQLQMRLAFSDHSYSCSDNSDYDVCNDGGDTIPAEDVRDKLIDIPTWICLLAIFGAAIVLRILAYRVLRQKHLGSSK